VKVKERKSIMNLNRLIYSNLLEWKNSTDRKPLILRGARHVGKTTLIRKFSAEFSTYIELNLERSAEKKLFEMQNANKIFQAACLLKEVVYSNKPTLLFIDEIQESAEAIKMLRYFYEDMPHIYIIAAGSLLEFSLKAVESFPVGRVEYLYLHPLNFPEFLAAINKGNALTALQEIPIPEYAHETLLNLFHEYTIIGGMPEIIANYVKTGNLSQLEPVYSRLWQSYKDDVEKYGQSATERKIIRHIIDTAPLEQDRIKLEGFGKSNYRSREVGEAIRALDMARIVMLMYPTTDMEPPIMPDLKKRPRLQFLDSGLLNQVLMVQGEMLPLKDLSDFYRGKIIQHVIYQEHISSYSQTYYKPHFWVREESSSNSEVNLVYRYKNLVIPIEMKSGKDGKLRSLHQFVERSGTKFAIRPITWVPKYRNMLPIWLKMKIYRNKYFSIFFNNTNNCFI